MLILLPALRLLQQVWGGEQPGGAQAVARGRHEGAPQRGGNAAGAHAGGLPAVRVGRVFLFAACTVPPAQRAVQPTHSQRPAPTCTTNLHRPAAAV